MGGWWGRGMEGVCMCSGNLQVLFKSVSVCILLYTCQNSRRKAMCSHHWSAVSLCAYECDTECMRHRKEMGEYDNTTPFWYTVEAVKDTE